MILKCKFCGFKKTASPFNSSIEKPMICDDCRRKLVTQRKVVEGDKQAKRDLLRSIMTKNAHVAKR